MINFLRFPDEIMINFLRFSALSYAFYFYLADRENDAFLHVFQNPVRPRRVTGCCSLTNVYLPGMASKDCKTSISISDHEKLGVKEKGRLITDG